MSKQLESLLREAGLASDIQLRRVQERVDQGAGSFIEILVKEERVPEEAIADAFADAPQGAARRGWRRSCSTRRRCARCPSAWPASTSACPSPSRGACWWWRWSNPIDYRAIQDIEFAAALDGAGRWSPRCRRCWTASTSATAPRTASGRSWPTCRRRRTSRSSPRTGRSCRSTWPTRCRRPRWRRSSRCAT